MITSTGMNGGANDLRRDDADVKAGTDRVKLRPHQLAPPDAHSHVSAPDSTESTTMLRVAFLGISGDPSTRCLEAVAERHQVVVVVESRSQPRLLKHPLAALRDR